MDAAKYQRLPFEYKIARFSLLLRRAYPFLGELCFRVEKYKKEIRAPAATDGYHLYLNEALLNELPQESFNFILLHELFHIILRHTFPKDMLFFEKPYWNIAYDLIVNKLIINMEQELRYKGIPAIPLADMALCYDDLSQDPSNRIAEAFLEQAKNQGVLTETPPVFVEIAWKSFNALVPNLGDYVFDILDAGDGISPPSEADIRNLLADCLEKAGKEGLPYPLRHLFQELTAGRKLPWFLILRRYLEAAKTLDDYSFYPPDKRMLYKDMVLPADNNEEKAVNDALIVLDVSSSLDKKELLQLIWQIKQVLTELDFDGFIIAFASDVHQEATLTDKQSLKKFIDDLQTGGGTDWADVVSYVKTHKRRFKPIIVFTDGWFFSFDAGLKDVIFIVQGNPPGELRKLGKVIQL